MAEIAVLTATLPSRSQLLNECHASVLCQTVQVQHLVGVDHDREGPAAIRNRLAQETDADWLLPLDDDDLLDRICAETLLDATEGADIVVPWCRVIDTPGMDQWTPNRLFRPEPLLTYNFVPVTALVSADLWRTVGGMPEKVDVEDWRMWRRCAAEGARFRVVPEICWSYRRGLSGSRNQWAETS